LTTKVGPAVGIWIVLLDAKSEIAVGAARVCDVPDVKPDIVSDIKDGTVSECVEVTEHETLAEVDAIVHVWAEAAFANMASNPAPTTNLRSMRNSEGLG
jgi:hypothetical protein